MQRRFGTAPGAGWQQAWQQLQAAVLAHASDDRVASFGVTAELLASSASMPLDLAVSSAQVGPLCSDAVWGLPIFIAVLMHAREGGVTALGWAW